MNLAINTDYLTSRGDVEPWLKAISEAGFTHLHWCHQWCTDFLYTAPELRRIASLLKSCGLRLLDIHGSAGQEKCWFDPEESRRKAGVLLVRNRAEMLSELGGTGSLMMHVPAIRTNTPAEAVPGIREQFGQLKKSLDELLPVLEKLHVRIAVENMPDDTFELIGELMRLYPESVMGITYDSGHGNINTALGLGKLAPWKGRLQALHLNDNDGSGDQHQPPFYGKVDWKTMAEILDGSSYDRELSFELAMRNTPFYEPELEVDQKPENTAKFLVDAHERCVRFANMTKKLKEQRTF